MNPLDFLGRPLNFVAEQGARVLGKNSHAETVLPLVEKTIKQTIAETPSSGGVCINNNFFFGTVVNVVPNSSSGPAPNIPTGCLTYAWENINDYRPLISTALFLGIGWGMFRFFESLTYDVPSEEQLSSFSENDAILRIEIWNQIDKLNES